MTASRARIIRVGDAAFTIVERYGDVDISVEELDAEALGVPACSAPYSGGVCTREAHTAETLHGSPNWHGRLSLRFPLTKVEEGLRLSSTNAHQNGPEMVVRNRVEADLLLLALAQAFAQFFGGGVAEAETESLLGAMSAEAVRHASEQ